MTAQLGELNGLKDFFHAQLKLVAVTPNIHEYIPPHFSPCPMNEPAITWHDNTSNEHETKLPWDAFTPGDTGTRVCLLGPAGTGKSLCLQAMRQTWLTSGLNQLEDGQTPDRIPLWVHADEATPGNARDPWDLVVRTLNLEKSGISLATFRAWYQAHRFVLLLDSLHELNNPSLADSLSEDCHWLVSCRPGMNPTAPEGWTGFRIEPFDKTQV